MASRALRWTPFRSVGHCLHHPLRSLYSSRRTASIWWHYDAWRIHNETRFSSLASPSAHHLARTSEQVDTKEDEDEAGDADNSLYTDPGFEPSKVMKDLARAAQWNQGGDTTADSEARSKRDRWDYQFCREAVQSYEQHLKFLQLRLQEHSFSVQSSSQDGITAIPLDKVVAPQLLEETSQLLSAETAYWAMKAVLKGKLHTTELSKRVRLLERLIGAIGKTPLTDKLSLRLVEANGKSGNIGRVLSLLNLRRSRKYPPVHREFAYAVQAIQSAGLPMREGRNILLGDSLQPDIDNPTRWLDAILTNMHQREYPLTTDMANRMLNCYATTGRTSKALHFFYYISRTKVLDPTTQKPVTLDSKEHQDMPKFRQGRIKVRLKFRPPPPYYKIPSQSRDKLVALPGSDVTQERKPKLEIESQTNWSLALTASFSFAESLQHGACGHAPIVLDVVSYNTLVKVCCCRGALWRAMQVIENTMPSQDLSPNTITYNTLLAGLARVGDTVTMNEIFLSMMNTGVPIDKLTIEAMVDGMLNMGDISGAITFTQDVFNQHLKLPPYTTHLKIIEFALSTDLIYEAKRHVYLIQQICKWTPNEHHDEETIRNMRQIQQNPKISKASLQTLFSFFGARLEDSDFI